MGDVQRNELTALDWMGALIAGAGIATLLVFRFAIAPIFARMFRDFTGSFHFLTKLAFTVWFAPLIALLALACLIAPWTFRRQAPLGARRLWLILAFALASAGLIANIVGMYLPIFELAGNIGQ